MDVQVGISRDWEWCDSKISTNPPCRRSMKPESAPKPSESANDSLRRTRTRQRYIDVKTLLRLNNAAITQLSPPPGISANAASICDNFDLLYSVPRKHRQTPPSHPANSRCSGQTCAWIKWWGQHPVLVKNQIWKEWLKKIKLGKSEPLPSIEDVPFTPTWNVVKRKQYYLLGNWRWTYSTN